MVTQLARPCSDCDKKFVPATRYSRKCPECIITIRCVRDAQSATLSRVKAAFVYAKKEGLMKQ